METALKNQTLHTLARLINESREQILLANQLDVLANQEADPALLDRLTVDDTKIDGMIASIDRVINMQDPEGQVLYKHQREDGLHIENRSVPFGKILIIYESRPDVTIEAAITAFKAGNRILLKGGKEAVNTNQHLVDLWHWALADSGLDVDFVESLNLDREQTQALIRDNSHAIDLIIPRGGDQLIKFVQNNTSVPALISGRGNNFLYADADCDFEMAITLASDGKSRLSVCNALDKILLHKGVPDLQQQLARMVTALLDQGITVFADAAVQDLNDKVLAMPDDEMWSEEFLAAKILIGLVDDEDQALRMINRYSGGHSAVIVCNNRQLAEKFQQTADCAAVYHNASMRFTDGGQFGLGAEIAISTQKMHFRGPVGLSELVTNKWFIDGQGQARG